MPDDSSGGDNGGLDCLSVCDTVLPPQDINLNMTTLANQSIIGSTSNCELVETIDTSNSKSVSSYFNNTSAAPNAIQHAKAATPPVGQSVTSHRFSAIISKGIRG